MFVVEISFNKTFQPSEIVYVKRPHFIIGSSPNAHVVVDEMSSLGYLLHFVKGKGNSFLCYSLANSDSNDEDNNLAETFYGYTKLDLNDVSLFVMVIDNDLLLRRIDVNPKNMLKTLRKATLTQTPIMPALVIFHSKPVIYSIETATEILLGRSQDCHIRIDAEGVDNIHCKLIYENSKFWIEDEISQGGIFVDGEKISKRIGLPPCKYFSLGGGINLMGINSEEQLSKMSSNQIAGNQAYETEDLMKYPCLISESSLVRPNKISIPVGKEIVLGRAPENDVWIGSPHISRRHLKISCDIKSEITLFDSSSNGSVCDGVLISEQGVKVSKAPHIIDLGDMVILGICYSKEDEELFLKSKNSVREFLKLVREKENKVKVKEGFINKISKKIFGILGIYTALDKKGKYVFCATVCLALLFLILVVRLLVEFIN